MFRTFVPRAVIGQFYEFWNQQKNMNDKVNV